MVLCNNVVGVEGEEIEGELECELETCEVENCEGLYISFLEILSVMIGSLSPTAGNKLSTVGEDWC